MAQWLRRQPRNVVLVCLRPVEIFSLLLTRSKRILSLIPRDGAVDSLSGGIGVWCIVYFQIKCTVTVNEDLFP